MPESHSTPESGNASMNWRLERRNGVVYFRVPEPGLSCIFTTRTEGVSTGHYESLNLAYGNGDDPERIRRNYSRLCAAFAVDRVLTLKQQHSPEVLYINYDKTPSEVLEGDAMFTDCRGLALGIKVADCLPIFLVGLDHPVVGAAHAGWRGTRDRIATRLVAAIRRKFEIRPERLAYAFGPCIGRDCYEVGEDVAYQFTSSFEAPDEFLRPKTDVTDATKFLLDLKAVNRRLLQGQGLVELADLDQCTHCTPGLFYSARRDGVTGRNLALIVRR